MKEITFIFSSACSARQDHHQCESRQPNSYHCSCGCTLNCDEEEEANYYYPVDDEGWHLVAAMKKSPFNRFTIKCLFAVLLSLAAEWSNTNPPRPPHPFRLWPYHPVIGLFNNNIIIIEGSQQQQQRQH